VSEASDRGTRERSSERTTGAGGIDVGGQIDAVRREVASAVRDGREAKVVTISQTYDADVEDVWDAVTNPDRIPRWFLPVTGELKLGGHYRFEGNAGGTITECEPPHRFAATWEFGGGLSWIEVELAPEPDGRTRFTLAHTAHPDEHWEMYGPGAVGIGWDGAVLGLAGYLAGAPAVTPENAMAWMTSDEGRAFYGASGERWYAADVAGGADPAAARGQADRTIAAYTASPACPEG
jgi:uncharacterized protein YndB with AHSA1/START domain